MPRKFVVLDHLRWIAASLVAVGHIRSFWMADYSGGSFAERAFYFLTGFGHQAVMVFFVLSGFLVGRKVIGEAGKPVPDVVGYMADRASRIFLVLMPALMLSAAALWFVVSYGHGSYVQGHWGFIITQPLSADLSAGRWLAALTLTNGLVAPTLVVDGPLWSLSCEWTYYVAAIAAVALFKRRASWVIPYAAVLAILVIVANPGVAFGGLVWSLGALAGWVSDRGGMKGALLKWVTAALAIGVFLLSRFHPLPDLVVGAPIALALAHVGWRSWSWGAGFGNRLASCSYSLYAIHYPLALAALAFSGLRERFAFGVGPVALVLAMFAAVYLLAAAFASQTEARTSAVRRVLLKLHTRLATAIA